MTYEALWEQVELCAAGLAGLGVKKGDRFGLVMRNCPEFVIVSFALFRLGAVAVPVNFLLKPAEMVYIFDHADVVGAAVQPAFLDAARKVQAVVPSMSRLVVCGEEAGSSDAITFADLLASSPSARNLPPLDVSPDDLAVLLYTSGTTGVPKGVMLSHGNFAVNVFDLLEVVGIRRNDVFICLLPMFHAFAFTVCVLAPLAAGVPTVIIESIQPFGNVVKQVWKHRVSIFIAVPAVFGALASRVRFWWPLRFLLPIRVGISGAAPLPASIIERFEAKFGVPICEGYGLTETSPVVTINPISGRRKIGTVGLPVKNTSVRITDEHGNDVSEGEIGEICVKGPNVMQGYFNDPESTRVSFYPGGWLRTGDLGGLDEDGYLRIADRLKDLIIVKGLNVYPREVEDVISRHPSVEEVAVVGLDDGQGDETVRAFVVLREGCAAEKAELLAICRDALASYKCPRDIEIRPELPKNGVGKVLKRQLREEMAGTDR